eukprot:7170097-Alexandrium_andersonii.AAC.1
MLPTCLRRVAEAAVVSVVGPLLESTLSEWQAARRGGTCRRNIRLALSHLEGAPRQPVEGPGDQRQRRQELVDGLLGLL